MASSFRSRALCAAVALLGHALGGSIRDDVPVSAISINFDSFRDSESISPRFVHHFKIGRTAPTLELSLARLPHCINETLQAYSLDWRALGGTVQRLLLWDAGYVLTDQGSLTRVYVECGLSMDEIVVSLDQFQAHDCPVRSCGQTLVAAGSCANSSTAVPVAKCAASILGVSVVPAAQWAQEQPNLDIPRPTVFRVAEQAYAIHMQDTGFSLKGENCPPQARIAIPCAEFNRGDPKWCIPRPTGAVASVLQDLKATSTHTGGSSGTDAVMPVVWLSAMFVAAVVGFTFVISRQRVQAMKQALNHEMNVKQLPEPSTTTQTSDGVSNFISIQCHEKPLAVPNDRIGRSLSGFSSGSGSDARSSYTDLVNASAVLGAFQKDPVVVEKRIPMVDILFSRRLCNGASGEVFLGRVNGHRVAIKQLVRLKRNELDDLENFAREIQLTATLNHPNVVQMIGVAWDTFQNMALVLEYRSGGDLLNAIRKRGARWSWNVEKLRVALGVAKGMVYLHSRAHPLVHRDIKSRNILIDAATMEPALCDFGSSRNVSALDLLSTDPAGTILWSAPEVICSQNYSVKADIYSFGVVLAELDTCSLPYTDERDSDGRTIQAIRIAHMVVENQIKPQLSELCPRFIRELVLKCVRHKPDQRPTAEEVLAKLTEAADDCAALWTSPVSE